MKIVVAPDSYKGSLSAQKVAYAMEKGIGHIDSGIEIIMIPLADGGEGTIDAIQKWKTSEIEVDVLNPQGTPIQTSFITMPYHGKEVAVIECARSTGLTLVDKQDRQPFLLNSYGLGQQVKRAVEEGYQQVFVTLGGSATTDGGTGMLQALGFHFYNESGEKLPDNRNIVTEVAKMDDSEVPDEVKNCSMTVLCDVTNPFYGENGAAYVYGPQKGADEGEVERLDTGLRKFAACVKSFNGIDLQKIAGAGAAGGLGGAFAGLLGGKMRSGFDTIAELVGLEVAIRDADLVLTGEGRLDGQSAHGKVPLSVARIAERHGAPCVGLVGSVERGIDYSPLTAVFSIQNGPVSMEKAIAEAEESLEFVSEQAVKLFCSKVNTNRP